MYKCTNFDFILLITKLLWLVGRLESSKLVNHTSSVDVVTPSDRPKSCNRSFCGVLCCHVAMGVGAFVIGLSQISSFFS